MKSVVTIEGRREGYSMEQIENTLTVGELIELLESFNPDTPIMLNNDNGYTYGSITEYSIELEEVEEETEE